MLLVDWLADECFRSIFLFLLFILGNNAFHCVCGDYGSEVLGVVEHERLLRFKVLVGRMLVGCFGKLPAFFSNWIGSIMDCIVF